MTELQLDEDVDALVEPLRTERPSDGRPGAGVAGGEGLASSPSDAVERGPAATHPGVTWRDDRLDGEPAVGVRRYAPAEAAGEPRPAVIWCHGGGWVGGDVDMPEAHVVAQRTCARLGVVVYSVSYRLAPDHRFPEPVDDVIAVLDHLAGGGDPAVDAERIVVGGASAGAHLVACALHAAMAAAVPMPVAAWLAYPCVDPIEGPLADERPACCPDLLWFDRSTVVALFGLHADAGEQQARPLLLDPTGLPPTLITSVPADALAPQAHAYADHLRAHGVEVGEHVVDGVLHGYLNMAGQAAVVDTALDRDLAWLAAYV